MDAEIDPTERRILGVLIEKQLATPDGYPMSVRDLVVGANQKTCRNPATQYQEWEIEGALASLFEKKWATYVDGGRVRKYKHRADELLDLTPTRLAVLAELLLRGSQQPGELRRNADRLARIPTDADLQSILDDLEKRKPPLVKCIGRAPRERDVRWTQRLNPDSLPDGGATTTQPAPAAAPSASTSPERTTPPPEPPAPAPMVTAAPRLDAADVLRRLEALEREVAALKARE